MTRERKKERKSCDPCSRDNHGRDREGRWDEDEGEGDAKEAAGGSKEREKEETTDRETCHAIKEDESSKVPKSGSLAGVMSNYHEESEEEQRERARMERAAIVEKYDLGRDGEGVVIDDWEDPKYEIYHSQDRYGFIQ